MGERAQAGDGVIAGAGPRRRPPVFCYAQDPSYLGGSLGEQHADSIVRVLRLAGRANVPVIGFIESGGARMQEGTAALAGYARIFREHVALSGRVPQISVICGASAGGGSYSPALTDFVVMTERATMFLTGPAVVREVMGEDVSAAELGGYKVHERNGVAHFVAADDADAALLVRDLLDHLPSHTGERAPRWRPAEPARLHAGRPGAGLRPLASTTSATSRAGSSTAAGCSSTRPRWARNIVCGFGRLDGRSGRRRRQPAQVPRRRARRRVRLQGRALRAHLQRVRPAAGRARRHARVPARHRRRRRTGVIRHGAKLVHAFAEATVPKVTVVLRKAFGGAFIAMNARDLGADYVFAWPQAQLGVMGAKQAVTIVNRRDIAAADDPVAARDGVRRRLRGRAPVGAASPPRRATSTRSSCPTTPAGASATP